MSVDRDLDTTRSVRSWLRTDGHKSADRVLDNVLALLDTTPQHRFWPVRRFPDMNFSLRLAIAAAAVVVVAIVGINLLPRSAGPGGGPAPSPSPSASPSPLASPSVSQSPQVRLPPEGPLGTGTQAVVLDGVPFTFELSSPGWAGFPGSIAKGTYAKPDGVAINLWSSAPDNVYADPCAHKPLSPAPARSSTGLAAAVAAIPGVDVVDAPRPVTIDGQSGTYVAIRIRDDITCGPHDFYLWYDESTGGASGGWRWAGALGAVHSVWMFDVDGKLIWIDGETFAGAKPETSREIQQVIETIRFG